SAPVTPPASAPTGPATTAPRTAPVTLPAVWRATGTFSLAASVVVCGRFVFDCFFLAMVVLRLVPGDEFYGQNGHIARLIIPNTNVFRQVGRRLRYVFLQSCLRHNEPIRTEPCVNTPPY